MKFQLAPRQAKFVDEYLLDSNAAAAARRAGYSAASSRVNGPRLLTNAAVCQALEERQRALRDDAHLDRQKVIDGLLEAVDLARSQQDAGAMIRAWSEIGRMCGFYAPERAVKVHANITAKRLIGQLEVLPDAELVKLVQASGVDS